MSLEQRFKAARQRRVQWRDQPHVRHDIQGLRAVAVVSVVVDHLTGWPGGGFLGVDVFFVISGFLITGLMLSERERTGRISIRRFYARRLRRLMPAAVTTLVVTLAVAKIVFFEDRFRTTAVDAVWALLFGANWRLMQQQTDYFLASGPVSPFQHYWSLSVEEQFYFVWPALLIAVGLVCAAIRRPAASRPLAGLAVAIIGTASFVYSLSLSGSAPIEAYFSTPARIWELSLGALLAVVAKHAARLSQPARTVMAWSGLGLIVWSFFTIDGSTGFPAPWAAVPVVGTALVIMAGTYGERSRQQRGLFPLTNPVSHYVGDLSYSLYLWHFPILVLAEAWYGREGTAYWPVVIVATLTVPVISYHAIEQPLRSAPPVFGHASRRARRKTWRQWREKWAPSYLNAGLASMVLTSSLLVLVVVQESALTSPSEASTTSREAERLLKQRGPQGDDREGRGVRLGDATLAVQKEVTQALTSTSWTDLEGLASQVQFSQADGECAGMDPTDPATCSFGPTDRPTVVVLGDSTAAAMVDSLNAAYGDSYHIKGFIALGCALTIDALYPADELTRYCADFTKKSLAVVAQERPLMTIVTETYEQVLANTETQDYSEQLGDWRSGKSALVDQLLDVSDAVVLAPAAPFGSDFATCATRTSRPADCFYSPQRYDLDVANVERSLATGRVHFLETLPLYCSAEQRCPVAAAGIRMKRDVVHTTPGWAEHVAPAIKEQLDPWLDSASRRQD